MIYDEFSKGKSVRVVIKRDELIDPITNIIKESGFNKVARVGRTNMMDVKIPKPTFEQLEQMSEKVDQLRTTAINKATAIKADSLQRIKAAMDKEYLEAPEAKQATEQIEVVLREVALHIQVIGRIKQKKMLKDQFVWEDKEKRLLLEPLMKKGIYRGLV
jgi:ribonuclease D